MTRGGWAGWSAAAAVVLGIVLLATAPAAAHVEVSPGTAAAGTGDVVLTFTAESESTTAGVTALRVVLPPGVAPADVGWVSGPPGWTLRTASDGYTVSGPAVPVGREVVYAVRIRRLPPRAGQLAFRTLQTYSDGRVDRWIELPQRGASEPPNPAPVLTVTGPVSPGASGATGASPGTVPSGPAPATTSAVSGRDSGAPPWVWPAGVVAVLAAGTALWWFLRRRRTT